jgi:hypothetical protein
MCFLKDFSYPILLVLVFNPSGTSGWLRRRQARSGMDTIDHRRGISCGWDAIIDQH